MRDTGEASDAMSIAAMRAVQGAVSGVRHSGSVRVRTIARAQPEKAIRSAVSRLLIDCRGRRRMGSVSSKGAASVNRTTPATSVRLPMEWWVRMASKRIPRSLPRAAGHGPQGTPAAYTMHACGIYDARIPSNAKEGWPGLRWTKDRFETRNYDMRF